MRICEWDSDLWEFDFVHMIFMSQTHTIEPFTLHKNQEQLINRMHFPRKKKSK